MNFDDIQASLDEPFTEDDMAEIASTLIEWGYTDVTSQYSPGPFRIYRDPNGKCIVCPTVQDVLDLVNS